MVGSLHMTSWPLGVAQRELWRATRSDDLAGAGFVALLLPAALRFLPLPVPKLRRFGYLALWPGEEELGRFAASSLARRWQGADDLLALTLKPIQSFGSWRGADPLRGAGEPGGEGPVLVVTHNRSRAGKLVPFLRREPPVIERLVSAEGRLWAEGFVDGIRRLDMGTLSLWESESDATSFAYGVGAHREAIRAQREGGWFAESWFGRFEVTAAKGSLPDFRSAPPDRVSASPM